MYHRNRGTGPERFRVNLGKRKVALKHVYRILLEREDCRVIENAKQRYEPKAAARQYFAEIADLERIVFFFRLTGLGIEFLVHEEINNEHYEGYHQQNNSESHTAGNIDIASESRKHW